MVTTSFEIVIASPRDDIMQALGYGMHRSQWPRDFQLADGDESIVDDLPIRWEAQLVGHHIAIRLKSVGESTSLTYTITVPEATQTTKLDDLKKKHEAAAKRLRTLVEAGEITGLSLH